MQSSLIYGLIEINNFKVNLQNVNRSEIASFLSTGIFQVMFSVIALDFFKLLPEQNGYMMAYFGIVQMVGVQTQTEIGDFV